MIVNYLAKLALAVILVSGLFLKVNAQSEPRNYLQKEYTSKGGLSTRDLINWREEKVNSLKIAIANLSIKEKRVIIQLADSALKKDWPSLRISDFLKYKNEGNIQAYNTPSQARKTQLTNLFIGELVSGNSGKYMKEIADGLWLLLEESTWVSPHHIFLQKSGEGLPDPFEPIIDLRSGDISSLVGWIRLLLHDELKNISPMIISKIDYKLDREIFNPFLSRNDLHWLGFGTGKVNNWNIWINTNILITALTAVDDETKRNKIIAKTVLSADQFLNRYPADGGCDEGVTYWNEAGGRLIQFVSMLTEASHNKLTWSDNQLIHNMGTYIYKMHIGSNKYVNFADAFAQNYPSPATVYQFGKVFNDQHLRQFASYLRAIENTVSGSRAVVYGDHNAFIKELETDAGIALEKPIAPLMKENWLPDLQVLTLRQNEGNSKGLFFAAKGGHNAESHNHNDIGNFVLYLDGEPFLIDAGVDTYTKQTFSKDRYTLWNMQSQWHNCPSINGYMQTNGRQYAAKEVAFSSSKKEQKFSMDIADAYPEEAGVEKWHREFVFTGNKGHLSLTESYKLNKFEKAFDLHFMTSMEAIKEKEGVVKISRNAKAIRINYDPKLFEVIIDDRPIAEGRLQTMWGKNLTRVSLRSKVQAVVGSHQITFN